eukprot:50295-Eustigmatos_ZCMA.PRE.1
MLISVEEIEEACKAIYKTLPPAVGYLRMASAGRRLYYGLTRVFVEKFVSEQEFSQLYRPVTRPIIARAQRPTQPIRSLQCDFTRMPASGIYSNIM